MFCAAGSQLAVKGRYRHVAGLVLNDTLLITGGYGGSVIGDLMSLKLPPSITASQLVSCTHLSVLLSPRERGNMFSPALVCVSVCLSVTTITKKIVDGFVPNFMGRFLGGKGRPSLTHNIRGWRLTPTYCKRQNHVTQKLGQKSNIRPR